MESTPNRDRSTELVAAVIVNHDQWLAVLDQLAAHYHSDPESFASIEWWVVHNGTEPVRAIALEFREQIVASAMESVQVVTTSNQGYGAAINRIAARTKRPFVLALNADILPTEGFLAATIKTAEKLSESHVPQRTAAVGFRLVNADGTMQGSAGSFPTLFRFLTGLLRPREVRKYIDPEVSAARNVDWVTGACLLIDRSCWMTIGGFDEQYFLYYEDVDLCLRMHQSGWSIRFEPGATCQHLFPYHARRLTPRMAFVARRAILLYYWKHRPTWEYWSLATIVRIECGFRRNNPSWSRIGTMVRALLADPLHHTIGPDDIPLLDAENRTDRH